MISDDYEVFAAKSISNGQLTRLRLQVRVR